MSASSPLKKGLFQPHVHYSFLKTASEGLSLSEEDFHSSMHDSPESDSESLAQEIQYQFELQKRIHKSEEVVGQSYDELEEDSLETDSLEEKSLTEEEQSEAEEIQTPSGSNCGEENYSKASDKEEMVDRYSDLRYDPNWKNKGVAGFTDLKESHQENGKSSPVLSLGLTCSPSQFRFIDRNNQLQKQLQRIPSIFDKEPSNSCEQPTSVSNRSDQQYKDQDNYQERVTVYHHNSNCSIYSNGSSTSTKASKRQQSEKDFVVKNKLTLGLAIPPHNSYLHLHGKMQREGTKDRSSQPSAPDLRSTPSPATWLIQAAEHHHQEISRLVDDHLAGSQFTGMLPPIIQRGESDWQLNMESSEESQPVLSRSNSEGYLLQVEKKKEKKNRKGSRTKGYMKMDVNLGGLGPDYETIREKSEKIKQKKEYAKQIKEHNMKSITSAQKPQPRPENKSSLSRQKALEYAKKIPKPKVYLSRPPEQEPKDDQSLVRPLDGENLPPISSLESLQNRHEKEKQVVAAFKTLHIV